MEKIRLIVLFLLLVPFSVIGQNLDSLYGIIESDEVDSTRIKTMLYTSRVLQHEDEMEAIQLANSASILAIENKEYKLAAQSFNQLGLISYFQGQLKDCKAYFEETMAYYELADMPLGIASAGNNIGVIEYEQGFYYNALNYFAESLVIRKANNDSASISVSYNNIGNVYKDLKQLYKAKDFYQKSIDLKKALNDDYGLAMTYNNLGQVYHDLGKFEKAIELYNTSIELKKKLDDQHGLAMTLANLGNSQKELGDVEIAEENIKKSIEIREEIGDEFGILHSKLSLAQLKLVQNENATALNLFKESLSAATEMEAYVQVKDAYFGLYQCYETNQDFEKALAYHKKYSDLSDSLNTDENLKIAKQVEVELELNEKDEKIQELTEQVATQKNKAFWTEPWFEFLMILIVLAIFMVGVFVFINKNSELSAQEYFRIERLRVLRLLFFAAALLAPILGYFRSISESSIYDSLWLRIGCSALIIIPLLGSYRSDRILNKFTSISYQLYYALTIFLFFFLVQNNIDGNYYVDVIIVVAAAPAVFLKIRHFSIFAMTYIFLAVIAYSLVAEPSMSVSEYALGIFVTLSVVSMVFIAKINSKKQLIRSNEIVNEVDALVLIANEKGRTIYASNSVKKILGYSPNEVVQKGWYKKVGFSDEAIREMHKNLGAIARGEEEPTVTDYQAFISKSGETKWILWKDKRIEGNRVLGIGQDVTERKKALDELKESENKFRQINETLSEVFYLYNIAELKYEYISPGCEKVMGADPEFFYKGLSHQKKFVHKEDLPIVEEANRLVNSGESYEIEYRVVVDGKIRWIRERSFPIENEKGEVFRNSGICQDITEVKQSQEELTKLSLVASNTTNYIIIAHVKDGIEWVNEAFEKKFGYTQKEVIGKFPSDVLHNRDSKVIQIIDKMVFQLGEKFSGEIVHHKKSGEKVYAKVDVIPLKNHNGEIDKYFVLGVDITDQKEQERNLGKAHADLKKKEAQLAESELNFRHLIKSIKQVFWLSDYNSRKLIFVSESYEKIFGVKAETLIENPKSWSDQVHPDDKERVVAEFQKSGRLGEFNEEYRITVKGKTKWVSSKTYLVNNNEGIPVMISGVSEDITAKKNQEIQLENLNKRLGVIHEIEKTILTSETTEDIIYNSLNKTLNSLPILRASLALFDYRNKNFYSYTSKADNVVSLTDKKVFSLKDFSALERLSVTKSHILMNIKDKEEKSKTDLILIEEGVNATLMSPLFHGDLLIGSFNVCFKDGVEQMEGLEDYVNISNEIANGLAIAIQQTRLKEQIESKNKEITSSINYAKMIQEAHIPKDLNHNGLIPNHTLFFRPKDIVSGDFYWTEEVDDNLVVVIGDCTGHGVPGAFMTIIGINLLSSIVIHHKVIDPGQILNMLNAEIINSLSSKRDVQIQDGMDVGVCVFNKKERTLKFAGAKRPLIHMRDGEMITINANKYSIGTDYEDANFTTHEIECGVKNRFYIYSDGFPDQFGGPETRKMNRRTVNNLIQQVHEKDFEEQTKLFIQAFDKWKGDIAQTDDVVLAGFEF